MSAPLDRFVLQARLQSETESVHSFIAAWLRGEVAQSPELFDKKLAGRLSDKLINIQPGGHILTRSQLLTSIRDGYGANPHFKITIKDFNLLQSWAKSGLALATYVEHQTGARNTTPADNARLSTVLFAIHDAAAPQWQHIHETALPNT